MSAVEAYLGELGDALHVRGAARRRFLRECGDHLADAAAEGGEAGAVRAFGPAQEVAAAFDAEVALTRGVRSTFVSVAGVLATGASTMALIHAASADHAASVGWAVTFFVAAQVAAVAAGLALLQALVARHAPMSPADLTLLARRNAIGLIAAGVTILAAGGAVPGHGSPLLILGGPALVCVALAAVLRARSLGRRLGGAGVRAARPPLEDLARVARLPVPAPGPQTLLALTTCAGAAAAFARDRIERGSAGEALVTAGVEGLAIVACFIVLGRALGLRTPRRPAPLPSPSSRRGR